MIIEACKNEQINISFQMFIILLKFIAAAANITLILSPNIPLQ